jgi:hypothetical protein
MMWEEGRPASVGRGRCPGHVWDCSDLWKGRGLGEPESAVRKVEAGRVEKQG